MTWAAYYINDEICEVLVHTLLTAMLMHGQTLAHLSFSRTTDFRISISLATILAFSASSAVTCFMTRTVECVLFRSPFTTCTQHGTTCTIRSEYEIKKLFWGMARMYVQLLLRLKYGSRFCDISMQEDSLIFTELIKSRNLACDGLKFNNDITSLFKPHNWSLLRAVIWL